MNINEQVQLFLAGLEYRCQCTRTLHEWRDAAFLALAIALGVLMKLFDALQWIFEERTRSSPATYRKEYKWFSFSLLPRGGKEINRKSTFLGL